MGTELRSTFLFFLAAPYGGMQDLSSLWPGSNLCPFQWKYRVLMLDCQGSPKVPIFLLTVGWGSLKLWGLTHSSLPRGSFHNMVVYFFRACRKPSAPGFFTWFLSLITRLFKSIQLIRSVPPVLKGDYPGYAHQGWSPGGHLKFCLMNLLWRHIPLSLWDLFIHFYWVNALCQALF